MPVVELPLKHTNKRASRLDSRLAHQIKINMTKKLKNYLLQIFSTVFLIQATYGVCGLFAGMRYADQTQFAQIRLGIWIFGIIAAVWFVLRVYNGFYRKMDFWIDENDHRY
jgi:hypothetical protein